MRCCITITIICCINIAKEINLLLQYNQRNNGKGGLTLSYRDVEETRTKGKK